MLLSKIKSDQFVIIESINLPTSISRKLDVIGIYVGSIIKVLFSESTKHIIILEINNIKYGIRQKDAMNIIVKKEN